MKVLVTEKLAESGLDLLREEFDVDVRLDLAAEGLAAEIGPYDALIVRSQTKVTAEVVQAGVALKVVGRAGVGIDNVDVDAATRRGVMVINAPQSNVLSAAEHALALLLAQARSIPQAHASLIAGSWDRGSFQGMELQGKTLGILGLGRVGTLVAQRALAFGMRLIAFDPFVPSDRARQLGIELVPDLAALLAEADVITVHLPRSPETEGLLGEKELRSMKPGARVVNTARGGIVDEAALAKVIADGHLGGAALDVFDEEPTTASPLFELDNVVVTPHLGAATREAQDKAGTSIAEMVKLALHGEFVPYAVNVAAAEVSELTRPFLPLAERLGRVLQGLSPDAVTALHVEYQGRVAEHDTSVLTLAVLKGLLGGVVHEPVSFVNAPIIARDRGITTSDTRRGEPEDYVNLISVTAETEGGPVEVGGTLVGPRDAERLVRIFDFDVEMPPAENMAFFLYEDRPGVIGTVGTILGDAGVNIADMEVGRKEAGGLALMGLTVDSPIPESVLEQIVREVGMKRARAIQA